LSSFDPQNQPLDQRLGDFPSGRLNDPAKCLPRDAHPLGRLLLVEPLVVGQSQGLELIDLQYDFFEIPSRDTGWLEQGRAGRKSDSAATLWTGHRWGSY
jgi:hypothetical protein